PDAAASQYATAQTSRLALRRFTHWDQQILRELVLLEHIHRREGLLIMNRLIWLVGAVVIVLFVLGYFGLR
ncbi:MAG: hypothetical protein ACSLEZ_06535, partial [Thiobacillus sp.]